MPRTRVRATRLLSQGLGLFLVAALVPWSGAGAQGFEQVIPPGQEDLVMAMARPPDTFPGGCLLDGRLYREMPENRYVMK